MNCVSGSAHLNITRDCQALSWGIICNKLALCWFNYNSWTISKLFYDTIFHRLGARPHSGFGCLPIACQYFGRCWPAMTLWCTGHLKRQGVDLPQDISSGMQHQMELMENTFLLVLFILLLFFPLLLLSSSFFHAPASCLVCPSCLFTLPHDVTSLTPKYLHPSQPPASVSMKCLHSSTCWNITFWWVVMPRWLLYVCWVER